MIQSIILTILVGVFYIIVTVGLDDIKVLVQRRQIEDIYKIWIDTLPVMIFAFMLMTGMIGDFIRFIMKLI